MHTYSSSDTANSSLHQLQWLLIVTKVVEAVQVFDDGGGAGGNAGIIREGLALNSTQLEHNERMGTNKGTNKLNY